MNEAVKRLNLAHAYSLRNRLHHGHRAAVQVTVSLQGRPKFSLGLRSAPEPAAVEASAPWPVRARCTAARSEGRLLAGSRPWLFVCWSLAQCNQLAQTILGPRALGWLHLETTAQHVSDENDGSIELKPNEPWRIRLSLRADHSGLISVLLIE